MLGLPSGGKLSRTRVEPKQSLKTLRKHRAEQCRLCNCSFKVKFGNSNISTENLFNPSKRKGCKGEILTQNLQRAGFEVVKCDKHSSRVCNPCARKNRNLGSQYSFVQESLQGKITEFTAPTVNFSK